MARDGIHKAMFERLYGEQYQIDDRDKEILQERIDARQKLTGPLVGDFLVTDIGLLRFTHDWGDTIQTTVKPGYDQSFYLSGSGHMSFSGSLNPGVNKAGLTATGEIRNGSCWFFSHNYAEAHNGIYVEVPCSVWKAA